MEEKQGNVRGMAKERSHSLLDHIIFLILLARLVKLFSNVKNGPHYCSISNNATFVHQPRCNP